MARPKKEVDETLLQKLTVLHLSDKVIADVLNISADTLHRRYAEKMEEWRSKSKSKIAEALFDEGINKREPWALKTLAQRHLDYADRVESENKNISMNKSDDELDARIDELTKRIVK